jgi:hypothetical protein
LIAGFLISAIVQVAFSRRAMERALGPSVRGVVNGTLLGVVASACSYGAAAAARGFFQKGADLRAVFAFMISSTNMNLAIVIMFWTIVGWKFAFAEFFGGIVIVAVVAAGITLLFRPDELRTLAAAMPQGPAAARVSECLQCGMEGEPEHAVEYAGSVYRFCGARHENEFRADPLRVLGAREDEAQAQGEGGFGALRRARTWRRILETARGDFDMLKNELLVGFVVAGFAAALVPQAWLANALRAVGAVPFAGYVLLLLAGLVLASLTFICSMGNVPIARYLAMAGIPLGANTTFIYGDLLIPPLLGIYRKSFPPKATWSFVGLFVLGALLAGALMDGLLGNVLGNVAMGSMELSDRFTLSANVLALAALLTVVAVARSAAGAGEARAGSAPLEQPQPQGEPALLGAPQGEPALLGAPQVAFTLLGGAQGEPVRIDLGTVSRPCCGGEPDRAAASVPEASAPASAEAGS